MEQRGAGRPPKYNKHTCPAVASAMRAEDKTNDEIAEVLGIDRATFYRWVNEHQEFCDALENSKAKTHKKLEESFYRRAMGGYTVTETEEYTDSTGKTYTKVKTKEMPPDTQMLQFALINLMPEKYSAKQTIDVRPAEDDPLSKALEGAADEIVRKVADKR